MEKINVKELNDNVFETIGKEWHALMDLLYSRRIYKLIFVRSKM